MCDAVLEREDSAAVLAELHQRIQLVIAIDPDERRFRLHHLLAEELTADLQRLEPAAGHRPARARLPVVRGPRATRDRRDPSRHRVRETWAWLSG